MRVVLFDIDGTLLLTGGAGLEALRQVFRAEFGLQDPLDGIDFAGITDPQIFRSIAMKWLSRELTDDENDRMSASYLEHLERVLSNGTTPFRVLPGARESVDELHAQPETLLGLATGNFERAAWAKLRRAGLHEHFEFGGFGSDSADRAELTRVAVARGRETAGMDAPVLLVGDTVHDVRCALEAGVECLAVATGKATEADLREAGAHWTTGSLESHAARQALGLAAS